MFKHLIKWKEECVNEYIVLFLCVQTGLLNKKKYKKQIKNNKTSHNGKISSNNQRISEISCWTTKVWSVYVWY